jgi:C4-dicarboxylate-specific signal transduction histidine kinase
VKEVLDQANMLSSLFNQIEPFSGRKRGRPKSVHTRAMIEQTVSLLKSEAKEKGVDLEVGDHDFITSFDEFEVQTVLVNLVENAIYWTASEPNQALRKVVVDARSNPDSSLTIIVSDSGPGVPIELRDRIFDAYFSSKPDGTGLGLSIAGSVVEDIYMGELTLVQGPLGGATFEATFRRRV